MSSLLISLKFDNFYRLGIKKNFYQWNGLSVVPIIDAILNKNELLNGNPIRLPNGRKDCCWVEHSWDYI